MPPRLTARVTPPHPITVAMEDECGSPLAYGVIANISEGGACLWTDGHLKVGVPVTLQISFVRPAEVHELSGLVVWGQVWREASYPGIRRYGLEWREPPTGSLARVRELASRAARAEKREPAWLPSGDQTPTVPIPRIPRGSKTS